MSLRQRTLVLVFALLGLGASAASSYVHYNLLRDPGYTSFCDISATVNCESVYQSAYGAIFGVPVALIGLLWFLLVVLLAWVNRPVASASAGSDTSSYLFILSTAALAVVLYMAYASFFVLKTVCVLCALTYVAVIGVFVVSGAASQSAMSSVPRRLIADFRRLLRSPVALTIACLYIVGVATALAFFPRHTVVSAAASEPAPVAAEAPAVQAAQIEEFEKWLGAQPRVPVMVPDDGAAVVVVKFNDYQCPPCRQTYLEYKPIIDRYLSQQPGKVKYVSKDFPLEAECNTGGVHVAGCEAAAAVRMARTKNKADAMEAWLFENQGSMSPDLVRQGVRQVAGVSDFDAQYPKILEEVRADVAQGRQLGVNRTPTFFINGVKIEGGLRPQFFDAAIAYELKRSAGR